MLTRFLPRIALLALAALVIAPSLGGDFLNWDDDRFVRDNRHVDALNLDNIAYAFGGLRFESYQPLHLVSYMVDGTLFRGAPAAYRVHNLVLFLVGVLLFFEWLRRLKLGVLPAFLGALFFAVAPYRIESVAWIACRKDVLMLVFLLAAWHLHFSASTARRAWLARSGAALLFVAALLAKSSALPFPGMVFAVDVALRGKSVKSAFRGILPYLPPALALGVALPFIWSDAALIRAPINTSPFGRLMLVGWTLYHYGATVLFPFRLSPLYAEPSEPVIRQGLIITGTTLAVAIAVLVSAWKKGRSIFKPLGVAAMTLLPLSPFLNLFPMYYLVADRYLLLPSLGLATGLALLYAAAEEKRMHKIALFAIVPFLLAMGIGAAFESTHWRTSTALWRHATEAEPHAYYARLKYGEILRAEGDYGQSVRQYRKAKEIRPLSPLALGGIFWGSLLLDLKETKVPGLPSPTQLVTNFLGMANDGQKLKGFAAGLRKRGLDRAADVVEERVGGALPKRTGIDR